MKYAHASYAFAPVALALACGAPVDRDATHSAPVNDADHPASAEAHGDPTVPNTQGATKVAEQNEEPVDVEAPTQRHPMPAVNGDSEQPDATEEAEPTQQEDKTDSDDGDSNSATAEDDKGDEVAHPDEGSNEPHLPNDATDANNTNDLASETLEKEQKPNEENANDSDANGTNSHDADTQDTGANADSSEETSDETQPQPDDEAPDLSVLHTALSSEHANDPYSCVQEQIVSGALCGTDTVRDGALCGTAIIQDATLCGTHVVTDAALCGTRIVEDATLCGVDHVTSGTLCGTRVVTDGLTCGWDAISSFFSGGSPKSCSVDLECDVPKSCEVDATCEIANECEVAAECEVPRSCEFESCSQTSPGGACLPGIAECDTRGFSCQFSADQDVFRCLPDFNTDLDMADKAVCEPFFDPGLSAMAQAAGITMSYSTGTAAGAGAAGSYEVGTVYGAGGEFGCFISTCVGAQLDLSIAQFASFGAFLEWDTFAGNDTSISVGGSVPLVELGVSSASVVSSSFGDYLGQVDSISLGVGLLPVTLAYMSCNTTVYQVQ